LCGNIKKNGGGGGGGRLLYDKAEVDVAVCEWLRMKATDLYRDGTFNWRQVAQILSVCLEIV